LSQVLARFALAFTLTQLIEVPIYMRGARVRPTIAFGASALTHPVVGFVIPHVADAIYAWMSRRGIEVVYRQDFRTLGFALLAEGFAVVVEAIYLGAFKVKRAFAWSLLANAMSAGIGYLLSSLTGWP
jgi:hypothetical protein